MRRLPASLDDLRGLRAARWVRESTKGQTDQFGPEAQRHLQAEAIARWGLVEADLPPWAPAHSGRTIAETAEWREMLAAAGVAFDVLVVAYVSRFARDLRAAVNARHEMHEAGAVILFADERLLSSDEDAWEQWARETVEAEAYSRRLGRRLAEGHAAKFRHLSDQAGHPPIGFRRRTERPFTMEIDPATIAIPVGVFEAYARGDVSFADVGDQFGLSAAAVREILRNPLFNGWVRRGRRHPLEERRPAAWRDNPPVSDALWERVHEIKRLRTRTTEAAPRTPWLLSGLLRCVCGSTIRRNGTQGAAQTPVVIHPRPVCDAWGDRVTLPRAWFEDVVSAQIEQIHVDDASIAQAVDLVVRQPVVRPPVDRSRRRRRELAIAHAEGRITVDEFLAAVATLEAPDPAPPEVDPITAAELVETIRNVPAMWADATPEGRRAFVLGVFCELIVRGREFVAATLTPEALRRGLDLLLPQKLVVVSREGSGLGTTIERDVIVVDAPIRSQRIA